MPVFYGGKFKAHRQDSVVEQNALIHAVLRHYPDVQAVYLFGSHGTESEWPDSDVNIALLLPPQTAKSVGSLVHTELESLLGKPVDLINLRQVSTVFQN